MKEVALESKRLLLAIVAMLVLAFGMVGLAACGGSNDSADGAADDTAATEATGFDDLEPVTLISTDSTSMGSPMVSCRMTVTQ